MSSPAVERAKEMMGVSFGRLPWLAVEYMKQLSREVGFCGEVCLTAWAAYAQCVEGLECTEELYKADDRDVEWFDNKKLDGRKLPIVLEGNNET